MIDMGASVVQNQISSHPKCRNCGEKKTIRAHIVPAWFGRELLRSGKSFVELRPKSAKSKQTGLFDKEILCGVCDKKLGVYDEYAATVFKRFPSHAIIRNGQFRLDNVDCDKLVSFVASVLWRASISKHEQCKDVNLDSWEDKLRKVIFNEAPLASIPQFQVLMIRYTSHITDPANIYSLPVRATGMDVNCYGMALKGFRILAKVDANPFSDDFTQIVINGKTYLYGIDQLFEKTTEFNRLIEMMRSAGVWSSAI